MAGAKCWLITSFMLRQSYSRNANLSKQYSTSLALPIGETATLGRNQPGRI